ncbi:MAG: alkaline phosphatase family protein [Candidatus Synoicihabitans palmerolidicus]|nr:alkaline phosphatase family protein [Candidatus Synoicihabitans palmerolidicus]
MVASCLQAANLLVILVSIDGCRWDNPELHDTPFLQELSHAGTRVERLIPSYPSKTFPNHYTLVTGLRPASHGIIQNRFYDSTFEAWFGIRSHPAAREGRWWGGESIWLTAQRQGLRTACFFWPGSEADILGQHPDKWLRYDDSISEIDRVRQVLQWTAYPPINVLT